MCCRFSVPFSEFVKKDWVTSHVLSFLGSFFRVCKKGLGVVNMRTLAGEAVPLLSVELANQWLFEAFRAHLL